jgi:hypothetical protein
VPSLFPGTDQILSISSPASRRSARILYKAFTGVHTLRASNKISEEKRGDNHMPDGLKTIRQGGEGTLHRVPFAPLVAVIAAIDAVLIFVLVAALSWQECVVVVLVATALAGGTAFTVLEMQRLGKKRSW